MPARRSTKPWHPKRPDLKATAFAWQLPWDWRGALVPAGGRNATEGRVGYGYGQVPFSVEEGALVLDVDAESAERWLYVVLGS